MSATRENEQLSPQDKNFVFFEVFHWGLLDRKVQTGLEFLTYYQNVCQKTPIKPFSFYKVSPAMCVGLQLLYWLQSFGFLTP